MAISVNEKYGANPDGHPSFLNTYGVTDTVYGVIKEPQTNSFILLETGGYLLQETGYKIALG